jgi:hypothetical protein
MQSLRERIIREVIARCRIAVAPVPVFRQPVIPLTRDQAPALIVVIDSDSPVRRSNDRMEREMHVTLKAMAQDASDGFAVADELLCRAHAALIGDVTLAGLALGITESDADWLAADGDIEAVVLPARYGIRYRTLVRDITLKG